ASFAEELARALGALAGGELDDLDGEVGAAEAVDEAGGVVEAELDDDVVLDKGGGGGGEGEDGGRAKEGEAFAEHAVVRAKVGAQVGEAVCSVNAAARWPTDEEES